MIVAGRSARSHAGDASSGRTAPPIFQSVSFRQGQDCNTNISERRFSTETRVVGRYATKSAIFPNFRPRSLTNDKLDLSFAQWNRYDPPASPCLRRGKGQPL